MQLFFERRESILLRLIAIVGPTAVGKTGAAIELALRINGEIISCDSMQVYRGLDIGTAKADLKERELVSHHLIDVAEIDEDYNVARYQREARKAIDEIAARGKVPILVGGTGLYYQALVDDYQFYPMESKQNVRNKWNNVIREYGLEKAYNHLLDIDPVYAGKISANDQKRIIRALEVFELTGKPFSLQQKKRTGAYDLAAVGLDMDRSYLYKRIEERVDDMLNRGWIEEVECLMNRHFKSDSNALQALGYQQIIWYLKGLLSRDEMVREIKKETRNYAKRQLTWFKRDRRIHWIKIENWHKNEMIVEKIFHHLEGQFPGA